MARYLVAFRVLGILLVAHALMLLGADEISTIEAGGVRTIRSLDTILSLYRADPKPWLASLPTVAAGVFGTLVSLPAWAVLFVIGGGLAFLGRERRL